MASPKAARGQSFYPLESFPARCASWLVTMAKDCLRISTPQNAARWGLNLPVAWLVNLEGGSNSPPTTDAGSRLPLPACFPSSPSLWEARHGLQSPATQAQLKGSAMAKVELLPGPPESIPPCSNTEGSARILEFQGEQMIRVTFFYPNKPGSRFRISQ